MQPRPIPGVNCLSSIDSRIPQMFKALIEIEDELQQLDISALEAHPPKSNLFTRLPYFCTIVLNDYPGVSVRGSIFITLGYHSNQLFNVAEIAFIRSDWQKSGCSGFPLV